MISGTQTTLGTGDVTIKVTDSTGAAASVTFSCQIAYVYADASHVDIPDNGAAVESPVTITGRDGESAVDGGPVL